MHGNRKDGRPFGRKPGGLFTVPPSPLPPQKNGINISNKLHPLKHLPTAYPPTKARIHSASSYGNSGSSCTFPPKRNGVLEVGLPLPSSAHGNDQKVAARIARADGSHPEMGVPMLLQTMAFQGGVSKAKQKAGPKFSRGPANGLVHLNPTK